MFESLFPIISTPDLQRLLRFYHDLLGGAVTYEFAGPDGRPAYVALRWDRSELGIGQLGSDDERSAGGPISLWLYAVDCDAAVERLRAAGVTVIEEPTDQPWGERVARVADPDGNVVIIGSRQGS